ncbi:fusaric acid resistance protein FusB [Gluconacetobacter entanii]|uniref:Fusaric acid resistance protein FusB n=2 Tax=Gluconacetobacter entanii TaxID=108528 RepID=A0A318PTP4_9PROT|nr:fusaric acid resistance protein FusB [Gluconacetobacter entanii]
MSVPLPSLPRPGWGRTLVKALSHLRDIFRDDARWRANMATAAFSARVLISMGIALFLAFSFQLQSPMSSVTTVMIVANPAVGALVSKSIWRMIGTVIGAVISVALMAAFVQSPILYIMALSVTVGLACMAATFLRLFRAYAAVLTGYTIVIIAAPAFGDPDGVFLSALSRLSAVVVGIVTTAAVFMVTSPRRSDPLLDQISTMFRDTVRYVLSRHDTGGAAMTDAAFHAQRAGLLAGIGRLSDAVEYAATDNYDISVRHREIRAGLARLSGIVAAYHPHAVIASGPAHASASPQDHPPADGLIADLMRALLQTLEATPLAEGCAGACLRIAQTREALLERAENTPSPRQLLFLDDARDLLSRLEHALRDLAHRGGNDRSLRLRPFMEWPTALRNGARGALTTLLAGLTWYVLHWTAGPMMMLYVVAASSLLSTAPSASRASGLLAGGTALGVPAGLLCHLFVLPRIDGYPLLWLSLGLFLLPGIWLQFNPRLGIGAFGYSVFSTIMLQINNPIHYNDISLMNEWMAILMGCCMLVLSFRVILPPNHRLDGARLVASLSRSVQRLALGRASFAGQWIVWENLQLQKVARLAMRLSFCAPAPVANHYVDAALAAISLGRLVERLHRLSDAADTPAPERRQLEEALAAFRNLTRDPLATAHALRDICARIGAGQALTSLPPRQMEAVACMEQAERIIVDIPTFLDRNGPIQWSDDYPRAREFFAVAQSGGTAP